MNKLKCTFAYEIEKSILWSKIIDNTQEVIFNFTAISNQLHQIGVIHTIRMCQKSAFRFQTTKKKKTFCSSKQMKEM